MMNGESLNIKQDNLTKLKEQFPNLFTEDKLDWEKLKAAFSDDINFSNERYILNWAGKADAFKALQIPTTATLKPAPEESINFETTENIFIEGENLEVLKVLQKSYYNKIKCIIIDPPYNTGNDSFIYPDSFKESKEEYQKRIGDKDEEGYLMKEGMFHKNSKDSGHFHSNWLNMMYPRLFLAKNLLREDGVILIHIDDNEILNLKAIMNEIFGEENFLANMIWHRRQNADNRNQNNASTDHEYILAYSKTSLFSFKGVGIDTTKYKNPDNDPRGAWASIDLSGLATKDKRPNLHFDITDPKTGILYPPNPRRGWSKSRTTIEQMIAENRILFPSNPNGRPREKKFLKDLTSEHTGFSSVLNKDDVGFTTNGTQEFSELFEGRFFAFPKPVALIKTLLHQSIEEGDLVLDFFAGSGTTAQAVIEISEENQMKVNFILTQLPELIEEGSEAKVAGYENISQISKERIRRVINRIEKKKSDSPDMFANEKQDLGFKVFKLTPSNFKIWRSNEINEDNLVQQLEAFTNPVQASSPEQNMLYELILKSGYLLTDKVKKYEIVDEGLDEKMHIKTSFYIVADGELIIALDKINPQVIELIIEQSPKKVIMLDNLFSGNDQLKTNTVLQMKDAGIDFKTI